MKKILLLMGRYFPKASANSLCVQNIIEALPQSEYQVEVIAFEDGLDDEYDISVLKFKRGLIDTALYRLEGDDSAKSAVFKRTLRIIKKGIQLLCMPIWPWFDPVTTYRELSLARKEQEKKHFDIVIAVHTPFSSLIVADRLKRENPDLQYIAYFLDSLSGGYVPHFVNESRYEEKCRKWETKLIKRADNIVFMESSKKHHSNLYKGMPFENKIVYFDLPMMVKRDYEQKKCCDHIKIVYVGSLSSTMRSPDYILRVFAEIKDPHWELIFVGDSSNQLVNEYANRDNRIKVIGKCSHEKALNYESEATILLNIGNKNPNMAPSKVFEYMSWCKKIVSTYSIDNDTSVLYLKRYPQALLLDERSNINSSAHELIKFANEKMEQLSFIDVSKEFYSNTPDAFIELL